MGVSYLTDRHQFVQVDDNQSASLPVIFGVPQGSIIGSILFNLYVSDLQDNVISNVSQYSDDTSFYGHTTVKQLKQCAEKVTNTLNELNSWSCDSDLLLNPKKSKFMLFSSKRLSRTHNLQDSNICEIKQNNLQLERVTEYKLLGIEFNEHLDWSNHFQNVIKSCYAKLAQLRKIKRYTSYNVRKQLAHSLIISKLDYCNLLFHNTPVYALNRHKRYKIAQHHLSLVNSANAQMYYN